MKALRVAVCQMDCRLGEWEANLEQIERVVRGHADRDLLVLPEMAVTGYLVGSQLRTLCEHQSAWREQCARLASDLGTTLVVGAPEMDGDDCFNASLIVEGGSGRISTYRKTHLYNNESAFHSAGDRLAPVDVCCGEHSVRLGPQICYDVEFPEVSRSLAAQGAQLMVIPSANMAPWGIYHEVFVQARAMENQVFVLYANRVGQEGGLRFCGGSAIAGPGGEILGRCVGEEDAALLATLDLDAIPAVRAKLHYWEDRRPELYERGGG